MENVEEILNEFGVYFNQLNDKFVTAANIKKFMKQSKSCPREPEALNRNEQAKEVDVVSYKLKDCVKGKNDGNWFKDNYSKTSTD